MSSEDGFWPFILKLIREPPVESIVRWVAVIYDFLAPGYMYVYVFEYKTFYELSSLKLLLLAFVLSVPVTYVFYMLVGNILRMRASVTSSNQANLRAKMLLGITLLVVFLEIAIFIAGISFKR